MDDILEREALPDAISIARCRELLGHEALALSDHDVDAVRRHAHAMAHLLIEIFHDQPTASLNR